ncbi:MAG TPA: rhomboid family intramembrane serine protease [Longimicrobiales bacterium]|nr:rhomboid family intramembrane serine protease [Longimicrobiales bacterium]
MTPWVRRLLIANVVMFIVAQPGSPLYSMLALYPGFVLVRPWGVFTYMFLHAGLGHILFNMIGLFFFGPRLEAWLGGKDFLKLYFLSGVGGAAFSFLFQPEYPVVGASAAVYGVLLAFALIWPQERIYIWAILPVPAWLLAALLVGGSLYAGLTGAQAGVAHFAHLGGLAFGFAYLRIRDWRKGSAKRDFQRKLEDAQGGRGGILQDRTAVKRWESIDVESLHELNRDEVVHLLEKARTDGARSLTTEERQFLDRMVASTGAS